MAESKVTIQLPNAVSLEKCLRQLEISDQRLAKMGPNRTGGPYDWQFVLSESFDDGSACVHFGVSWYDLEFFLEKKDSFRDNQHNSILQNIGIDPSRMSVDHWVRTK